MNEWIALLMFLTVCLVLMAGFPVAFSLAGTAIIFAVAGVAIDAFQLSDFVQSVFVVSSHSVANYYLTWTSTNYPEESG